MIPLGGRRRASAGIACERGFTLLEVMFGIVLMTVGLLAVADVLPWGLALSLYGKDQTKAASLALQGVECLKYQPTSVLSGFVADYANSRSPTPTVCNPSSSAAFSAYFDQNGNTATQAAAYFTRDVQIQYWTWNTSTSQFTQPASPYTAPSSGTQYVYRVSVATHWKQRGQTIFTSGNTTSPNGCVTGASAVPTGLGCVQVSTFISP